MPFGCQNTAPGRLRDGSEKRSISRPILRWSRSFASSTRFKCASSSSGEKNAVPWTRCMGIPFASPRQCAPETERIRTAASHDVSGTWGPSHMSVKAPES